MKPVFIPANVVSTALTVLPTAKIIRHPDSRKIKKVPGGTPTPHVTVVPPDEETLARLNAMAKQHPFCIRHKGNNSQLL